VDWWVLDLERDPTPGSPAAIRRMARSWSGLADDAEYAETRIRQLMGDEALGRWIGEAGDAFRSKTGDLPEQLGKCKNSYRQASEALEWWADRLDIHQGDADAALVKGRAARDDLEAARARASAAAAAVTGAANAGALTNPDLEPTPEQVRDARARLSTARAASSSADAAVDAAQARLDQARALALDAKSLREADGRSTASKVHEASDAGIPERSRWEKFKDWAGEAWDVIVTIAKVVVAVLGIVALIIGGPLAWVVFAAALVLLADAIMKYMNGEGSLWDVAWAALGCIPGTKGLTTLGALRNAFRSGGALAAGAHVLGSARAAVTSMAAAVRSGAGRTRTAMLALMDGGVARLDNLVQPGSRFAAPYMRVRAGYHSLRGGAFTPEGNMVISRWTPAHPVGPLGDGYPANTFRSMSYDEVRVVSDQTAYRAVTNGSNLNGGFWSFDAPAGPLQQQLDLALLPEWQMTTHPGGLHVTNPQATHVVEATLPPGATVYQGPAGPQTGTTIPGHLDGGGEQIYVPQMPADWLTPGVRKLQP
jgi:hypothetical protein